MSRRWLPSICGRELRPSICQMLATSRQRCDGRCGVQMPEWLLLLARESTMRTHRQTAKLQAIAIEFVRKHPNRLDQSRQSQKIEILIDRMKGEE